MNKEELFNQFQKIVLNTSGGNDDYVVAICKISNLLKEFTEIQDKQFVKLKSDNASLEKQVKAWSEECGNRFLKLKEKDEEIERLNKIIEQLIKQKGT